MVRTRNAILLGVGVFTAARRALSHTTTSNTNTWNSGTVAPGAKFSVTFPTAGTFPYHCAIHPGMVGSVVVR